jgi:predicted nucleic acid-binding protein
MKRFLLDTSALLALRDNEPGADQVADLLYKAQKGESKCLSCFVTLMEIFYRVWKDEGEQEGRLAYEKCKSLPIEWIHESHLLLEKAAEIKATHKLSLADAWIAASALLADAVLIHKDLEFEHLNCEQLVLPYKSSQGI